MYSPRRGTSRSFFLFLLAPIALLAANCGGSLYRVKPTVELPAIAGEVKSVSAGGLTLRVAPLLTDEDTQDLFEANLPLSGVLPLRVALHYEGDALLELKRARVHLRDGVGREWKLLNSKQTASKIMKSNGVTLYNPNAKKQFESDIASYALDLTTPLNSGDRSRQGFLFFEAPGKEAVESPRGLMLIIDRLPQPLQIAIN
jgi:hypothetical protein